MATTFIGTLSGGLVGSFAKTSDLTTVLEAINYSFSSSYTNGTGANQANAFFADTRTLANGTESFDLNAATMVDSFGNTLNFTAIVLLFVKNKSAVIGQRLSLTGDFLNGETSSALFGTTTPTIRVGTGGFVLLESPLDGFLVTSTISDVLTVTNGATFDYDILMLGRV